MGLGDIFTGAGQAIEDLFGSEGASAEANSFTTAAQLADQNAALTAASTRIQQTQTARQIFQTEGTQLADVAGAGFTESGSALDLLRSSAQQGSLAQALTNIQGAITENSYAAQAGAYRGAAASANEKSTANTIGAISAIGGALLNNSDSLVSAGKTVVQGINYLSDSLFGSSAVAAGDVFGGAAAASEAANTAAFLGPASNSIGAQIYNPTLFNTGSLWGSGVDQAISGGSNLSTSVASADIGLDTSGLSIGTDLSDAFSGIGDAFSSISDSVGGFLSDVTSGIGDSLGIGSLSDLIPGVGWITGASSLLNMIPGWSDIPVLGDITSGISDAVGAVTGAIGDVIGDVADGIGDVLGSVICTAYYKQGFIRHRTWMGDQHYGAQCNPQVYRGYLFWGKPIAAQIIKRRWVANLLFPVFNPTIKEMAATMGVGKSTFTGKLSLKAFIGISWAVGYFLTEKKEAYYAVKS